MRDEHYTLFTGAPPSDPPQLEAVTVFVMARLRVDQTDSMRGALRAGPHGWDAVYLLNGELYRTQWCATETAGAPTWRRIRDALAAAGWMPVPFHP